MHPELSKRLVLQQLGEALRDERLFSDRVHLEEVGYPCFFVRFTNRRGIIRLLRFDCADYDFQPLSVEPVDPITREPLAEDAQWLRRGLPFPAHPMHQGRPFLCLQGTRDYYTHPDHRPQLTDQRWEQHRAEYRIPDLLRAIRGKFWSGEWE